MSRPVADSPTYLGDRFYIEIPNANVTGWLIHKISMNIIDHQKHIDGMIAAGNTNFRERKTSRE